MSASMEKTNDSASLSSVAQILVQEEAQRREAQILYEERKEKEIEISSLPEQQQEAIPRVFSPEPLRVRNSASPSIVKKHNTTKGLIKDVYPSIAMEVTDENWDDWNNHLLAYGHANDCVDVIFKNFDESLQSMISTFGNFYEVIVIMRGHKMAHAALYQRLLETVNKSSGKQMNESLRLRQEGHAKVIHFNVHELYLLILERYGKKNELVEIIRTYRALNAPDLRYNLSESPDKYRSLVMSRIQDYCIAIKQPMGEKFGVSIVLNGIPEKLHMEIGLIIKQANGVITTDRIFDSLQEIWARNRFNRGKGTKRDHEEANAAMEQARKKKKTNPSPRFKCWLCNGNGHTKKNCPNIEQLKARGVDVTGVPFRPQYGRAKKEDQTKENQAEKTEANSGKPGNTFADRNKMDSFNCFLTSEENYEEAHQIADPRWRNPKVLHADCAASTHMVPDGSLLRDVQQYEYPIPVTGALSGCQTTLNEAGSLRISNRVTLNNVAHCPKAQISLISEHRLLMSGRHVIIKDGRTSKLYYMDDVNITENNPPILTFVKRGCFWVKDLEGADEDLSNMGGADNLGRSVQNTRSRGSRRSNSSTSSADTSGIADQPSSSNSSTANNPLSRIPRLPGRANNEEGNEETLSTLTHSSAPLLKRLKNLEGGAVCALSEETIENKDEGDDVDDVDVQKEAKKILQSESVAKWHQRYGHCSGKKLLEANKKYRLRMNEDEIRAFMKKICEECVRSNMRRASIHRSGNDHPIFDPIDVGMVFYLDAFGPVTIVSSVDGKMRKVNCPSMDGDLYGLVGVEALTTVVKYNGLQKKSQIVAIVPVWIKQIERETGRMIQYLHSDNAKEIIGKDMKNVLDNNGIQFSNTTYYHPEHNGVVERMIGKIRSIARVLLVSSGAPTNLWNLATEWAVFLHNNLPSTKLGGKSPMESYINFRFDMAEHARVWGCDAFVLKSNPKRGKTQAKGWLGIFVGWSTRRTAYRVIDQSCEVFETVDVRFNEESFKAMKILAESVRTGVVKPKNAIRSGVDLISYSMSNDETEDVMIHEKDDNGIRNEVIPIAEQKQIEASDEEEEIPPDSQVTDTPMNKLSHEERLHEKILQKIKELEGRGQISTRSGRVVKPTLLGEIVMMVHESNETEIADALSSESKPMPWTKLDPKSYEEAISQEDGPEWRIAIKEEMDSLLKNKTWKLVLREAGMKVLTSKWVLHYKLGEFNELIRRKARLVIRGFEQKYGVDFFETFAPVVKSRTIRLLLIIVALENLELKQLDFDTAFLNGILKELVYMEQPEGFIEDPLKVCLLIKSIYGLKQAARVWYEAISELLIKLNWVRSRIDTCFFTKMSKSGNRMYLALYVDDTTVAYKSIDEEEWLNDKKKISEQYKIKDIGDLYWIFNMKVIRDRTAKTITLCQTAYVESMLMSYDMHNCKDSDNPEGSVPLNEIESEELNLEEHSEYRSLVGALLYAAITTRIDIAHAVGMLCRNVAKPSKCHLNAAYRVLRYLSKTSTLGLVFGKGNGRGIELEAYTDASWGDSQELRRSVTGIVILYKGNVVHWISKRQVTVALSSTEAEYMALSNTVQEILWFKMWIKETFGRDVVVPIYCDNESAMTIAENENITSRSKHIDIRYHFIKDHISSGDITLKWVSTDEQDADLLTKRMSTKRFEKFREKMMVPC